MTVSHQPDGAEARAWAYVAEQSDGHIVRGELVARDAAEAARLVRELGVTPISVRPAGRGFTLFGGRTNLSATETIDLVRGVADLITAGLPLKEAFASLAEREKRPALRNAIRRLEGRLQRGDSFSAALRADPAGLPRSMIALAEAGEESGLLGKNYSDLAEQMERDQALRQELIGQMIYPLAILTMMAATLMFMAHILLPQLEGVFDGNTEPPPITAFVFDAGRFLRQWGIWIPPGILLVAILVRNAARLIPETVERLAGMIPVVGTTRLQVEAVRYCRALGLLTAAGTPLARAEPVARETIGSIGLRARHAAAADAVRAGESLSVALSRHHALPDEALRLVALGERSGNLDTMLLRAADLMDRRVRARLKRVVELISPLMIVILALAVGGVLVAVILGVLSLNEAVF